MASSAAAAMPRGRAYTGASSSVAHIRAGSKTAERLMSGGVGLFHQTHHVSASEPPAGGGNIHRGDYQSEAHATSAIGIDSDDRRPHSTGASLSSGDEARVKVVAPATAAASTGIGGSVSSTFAASRNFFASLVNSTSSQDAHVPPGRVVVVPAKGAGTLRSNASSSTSSSNQPRAGSVVAATAAAVSTTATTSLHSETASTAVPSRKTIFNVPGDDSHASGQHGSLSSGEHDDMSPGSAALHRVSTSATAAVVSSSISPYHGSADSTSFSSGALKPVPPPGRKKATSSAAAALTTSSSAAHPSDEQHAGAMHSTEATAPVPGPLSSPTDAPRPAISVVASGDKEQQPQHPAIGVPLSSDSRSSSPVASSSSALTSDLRSPTDVHLNLALTSLDPSLAAPVPAAAAASAPEASSTTLAAAPSEVVQEGSDAWTPLTSAADQPPQLPNLPAAKEAPLEPPVAQAPEGIPAADGAPAGEVKHNHSSSAFPTGALVASSHSNQHEVGPSPHGSHPGNANSVGHNHSGNQNNHSGHSRAGGGGAGIDVRTYIPRSGSTGLRFSDALKAEMATLHAIAAAATTDDAAQEARPAPLLASPASPSPPRKSTASTSSSSSSSSSSSGISNPLAPGSSTAAAVMAAAATPVRASRRTILIQPASSSNNNSDAATAPAGGHTLRSLVNARAAAASLTASGAAGGGGGASSINIVASSRALLIQPPQTSVTSPSTGAEGSLSAQSASKAASSKPAPRAPLGVPELAMAPIGELTPAQRKERSKRIRLENSRCEKWREMLARWNEWAGPHKAVGIFSGFAALPGSNDALAAAAAASASSSSAPGDGGFDSPGGPMSASSGGGVVSSLVPSFISAPLSSLSLSLPSISLPSILGGSSGGASSPAPSPPTTAGGPMASSSSSSSSAASGGGTAASAPADAAANAAMAAAARYEVVKRRCRKGIPDPLRAQAWMALLRADEAMKREPQLYQKLLALPVLLSPPSDGSAAGEEDSDAAPDTAPTAEVGTAPASSPAPSASSLTSNATVAIIDTIERDINRTFPHLDIFKEVGGLGQTALFRILVAYAQLDADVGYCQGMAFVAAVFLSFMPEEQAFYAFKTAMLEPPHRLASIFAPGLPKVALLQHVLQSLINTRLPTLAAHLHSFGIHPTMFAAQWILTLFSTTLPFPLVVRIWDCYLCEGWKVFFRVALSALKHTEADFLKCSAFEDIMMTFRELPQKLQADSLIEGAYAVGNLTSKELLALEAEYYAITAAGFEHSSPAAGFGLAAHEKMKAAQEAEREARRKAAATKRR